ncbi:MAG: N-acetylneuraminate synthase family protein, partial [Acetivibrio ethanolgignens]
TMNLKTIASLEEVFGCIVGLSDHSEGTAVAVAGVALGAKMVEKHLTLKRSDGGCDAGFSMEVEEFKEMCSQIRMAEKAIGHVSYELSTEQQREREHSRSLFVTRDMKAGDIFNRENLRSIRPGFGLHTKYYEDILGKRAKSDITKGTPLGWEMIE